ncbi:DUF4153 domain-containing protein [Hymenobacter nivis]|uniref:DUF4153 domain-containing protein n=1 Tax=Hymenobacter nivis TaxID=1850093 RepID=A0A502GXB3_9BACT|nr:DUF4153 domain-containing protein [Hymenobacter nivis]TPG66534.1 DUF4153 domain-containing protein [Hymenobacter nivis]
MTKLPSLQRVAAQAGRVARRFPLTLLCAAVVCVAGCQAIAYSNLEGEQPVWVFPLLSAGALGVPLTLALALAAARYRWPAAGRWAALAGALALLAGWAVLAPALPGLVWGLRLAVLLLGLHLAVAAAPYLGELRRGADTPGFWRYNEALLRRLLTGGLYAGVLWAGGAVALVAVRELFGFYFSPDLFGYLFVGLATIFNTWFFLAGVPEDFAALEQDAPYPRGLKVFTQFVLLPLVALYVGILYAYLGRILLTWTLPQGWVAALILALILALAVAGILALLLIHPLRNSPENTWIRTFARWFYRALFPLLGLLAVAIGTRIRAYGLTEERYFVLLLAAWLLGMAAYFLWRRGQGIIWVPVTLAGLAFGSAAGPWGAFAVAERSQLAQLRALTSRYQLLQKGRLDGAARRVPSLPRPVRGRLSSLFDFFSRCDALARLQLQFAGPLHLPDSLRHRDAYEQQEWRQDRPFALSGFEHYEPYQLQNALNEGPENNSINFYVRDPAKYVALGQGRYWLKDVGSSAFSFDSATSRGDAGLVLPLPEGTFRLLTNFAGDSLQLQQRQQQQGPPGRWHTQLRLALRAPTDSLVRRYGRTNAAASIDLPAPVELRAGNAHMRLRLFITTLNREQDGGEVRYYYSAEGLLEITP